ncbi:MAG: ROK family protein [Thermaerobacter sp.]|nr:ROK family protein [Thermaerobacter sp.]
MAYYGAVDIGGTKIAVGIGSEDGALLASERFATPRFGPEQGIHDIVQAIGNLCAQLHIAETQLTALGVGTPGPLAGSRLLKSANLPEWEGIDLAVSLRLRAGFRVSVQNDATAAAMGEWYYGAGRRVNDMVYITVSTGIGGGIIAGGREVSGTDGNAGELGHIVLERNGPLCQCGHYGCLEALASGTAIGRIGQERQPESDYLRTLGVITAADVFLGAHRRDPVCDEIVQQTAEYLGLGVSYLINLTNPTRVVMGGGVMAHAGAQFLDRVRAAAERFSMPALFSATEIDLAALGEDSGLVGALAVGILGSAK